jgi:putative ABC transport system permease protein
MFRNYLVPALRNFARYRLYTFINIGRLAVGLAGAMLIVLFLHDELSWNRWIPGSANIRRLAIACFNFTNLATARGTNRSSQCFATGS